MTQDMTQEEWLRYGWGRGWCSAPVCSTHDGVPYSVEEDDAMMAGDDSCVHVVRLYDDETVREAVEANHSPSQWRASNRGWVQ